jgi:cytoskeletal protein RodZ
MYARWKTEEQESLRLPLTPGVPPAPSSRIEKASGHSILGLDSQLAAALEGASWAVAAFAPEDVLWADWLYRNLNGYPVPTTLIEQPTAHGLPRPDCLSIFPDRRDPHYAELYSLALEKSGYLIVVCSRHSAHCAAVDAQIRAFKSAGGEDRIIALIVEGGPDAALETIPKPPAPSWLPPWLSWRLAGETFAEADRGEPRIVDARPGRTSLKEVRDLLLATLLDIDAWELEVLGSLARPVEIVQATLPAPAPEPAPVAAPVAAPRRKVGPVVLTAAICVSVTLVTAWWSFGQVQRQPLPSAAMQPGAEKILSTKSSHRAPVIPAAEESETVATTAAADTAEPEASLLDVYFPKLPAPTPVPAAQVDIPAVNPAPAPAPVVAMPPAPAPATEDSVNRAAVASLHQRGDAAVSQRRLDDALGYYEEAVDTARVTGPHASAESRAEAALLCRKLGTLQLQMASTSEARASFVQGRKLLLALKKQGAWNAERAKTLSEIEKSLNQLPRD